MKIFIGTHENCGIIAHLSNGFKALGHSTFTLVKKRDPFFKEEEYDYDVADHIPAFVTRWKNSGLFPINKIAARTHRLLEKKALKKYFREADDFDLYIYTWESLFDDLSDLEELKKRGKKIFFLFIGSDARHYSAYDQEYPNVSVRWAGHQLKEDLNKKLLFLRKVEVLADYIFSLPEQSGLLVKPYNHVYLPFPVKSIPFFFPDNEVPKIVHAPSNREIKGTIKVLEAIQVLQKEGLKFEFTLLEAVPNAVVKQHLHDSDIVIDQIKFLGVGMFGTEALAHGCALATRNLSSEYGVKYNPPTCVIDETDLIVKNLRELIMNREMRKKLAYEGRAYVENVVQPEIICAKILSQYEKEPDSYDYEPRFFAEHYVLPEGVQLKPEIKKLNKKVLEDFYTYPINYRSLKERGLI